jgi:acetyltransferase-like isoleucine patch superfamily enzyme
MFKWLPDINIVSTLLLNRKIIILRKVQLGLENGHSIINNSGRLILGMTFPKCGYVESHLTLRKNSCLIINGKFDIYTGFRISVNENAVLELGSGYMNYNINIACFNRIKIGHDVAIAENVTIRDSDNHQIIYSNYEISKPIDIGNHVWIGMNATILKGVNIGDGAVVAAGSVVTRNIPENCLVAGVPARIIKNNVRWV